MHSVTQILKPYTDFSGVDPAVLDNAAARGSLAHSACAAIVQGLWAMETDDIAGYCKSFRHWMNKATPQPIAVELELIDHHLGFCGHPDLICQIGTDIVLIDLKTPAAISKTWRIQLAAYHHLANLHLNHKVNRVAILRLSKDGKPPKFIEFTSTINTDFAVFLNCLSAFKYFYGGE